MRPNAGKFYGLYYVRHTVIALLRYHFYPISKLSTKILDQWEFCRSQILARVHPTLLGKWLLTVSMYRVST